MDSIREMYSSMIDTYGPHAKGVGWSDNSTQRARFFQLLKYESLAKRDVIDAGCGYGALVNYISHQRPTSYLGIDENGLMLDKLSELHSRKTWVKSMEGDIFDEDFDFQGKIEGGGVAVIASGLMTYARMNDLEAFLENINPHAGYVAFNFFTEKVKYKSTFEAGEKVFKVADVLQCCLDKIENIVGIKSNLYMNGYECAVRIKTEDW